MGQRMVGEREGNVERIGADVESIDTRLLGGGKPNSFYFSPNAQKRAARDTFRGPDQEIGSQ
jgi:hypothetical protein